MTQSFADLADRTRANWDADATQMYQAASRVFEREVEAAARLGVQLRAARAARGLSQAELASATGIHQSEISRIERGLGNPTAETLSRLAAGTAMRLSLEPLTTGR